MSSLSAVVASEPLVLRTRPRPGTLPAYARLMISLKNGVSGNRPTSEPAPIFTSPPRVFENRDPVMVPPPLATNFLCCDGSKGVSMMGGLVETQPATISPRHKTDKFFIRENFRHFFLIALEVSFSSFGLSILFSATFPPEEIS